MPQDLEVDYQVFVVMGFVLILFEEDSSDDYLNLTMNIIEEFYITRIYGSYDCEKFINISLIENNMKLKKKINGNDSCHFEIWNK